MSPSPDDHEPLIGLAALMRMAFSGTDLAPLGTQLIARAERNPDDANALMDLSTVLQLRGNRETALEVQAQALQIQQLYRPPSAGSQAGIRLLAIMGPGDLMANSPLEFLLEGADVALDLLYIAPNLPLPTSLPEHDVLFVAIAQSDKNFPLLNEIASALKSWLRPVLNKPDRITLLSRDGACALLKSIPGVVMPVMARLSRLVLEQISERTEALEDQLMQRATPEVLQTLHQLKRETLTLRRSVWPLREVVATLTRGEGRFFQAETLPYLRDVYDHTVHVIESLEAIRDLIAGMLDIYLSSISNRVNQEVRLLTVIALIFMPATMVSGIFGMNFRAMPLLDNPLGFYFALGMIAAIASVFSIAFWRRRWLD